MMQSSNRHRRYLAAALAAAVFGQSHARAAAIVAAFHTWAEAVDACTELADVLYDRWSETPITWGETHEQYDVLDRIAELWYVTLTRDDGRTHAQIVDQALAASVAHDAERRAARIADPAAHVRGDFLATEPKRRDGLKAEAQYDPWNPPTGGEVAIAAAIDHALAAALSDASAGSTVTTWEYAYDDEGAHCPQGYAFVVTVTRETPATS